MQNKFFAKYYGKIIFVPWVVAYTSLSIFQIIIVLIRVLFRTSAVKKKLMIEAGIDGWKSIEFKELYQSAIEYLPKENVIRLEIDKKKSYIPQVLNLIKENPISHYLHDPRTGSQNFLIGFLEAVFLSHYFLVKGITPISLSTDLSVRKWRLSSAVITAKSGVTLTFMDPELVKPIFPHSRLLGPCLMPFSLKLLNNLNKFISASSTKGSNGHAIFTGSLYEPRETSLKMIESEITKLDGQFSILGRIVGSERVSDNIYWKRLIDNDIIVTTASQMRQQGTDLVWIPHLLYRYLEVLASGSLLIAPNVPGLARYFTADVDFVSFFTEKEAAEKIKFYQLNPMLRIKVSHSGKQKAENLIKSKIFWLMIDSALGKNCLI